MKRALVVVAVVIVIVIAIFLIRPLFQGDGNATFVSYAPGGRGMAYVNVDDVGGMEIARSDQSDFVNGDRVKVELGNDGLYVITAGPYR